MKTGDLSVQKTPVATDDAATKAYVDGKSHGFGSLSTNGKITSGTVYQAATDLIVHSYMTALTGGGTINGYTDSNNPPTTRTIVNASPTTSADFGITFAVKKGNYWKVVVTNLDGTELYARAIAIGS